MNSPIISSFEKLFKAKNELLICSPYISPNYLTELIDISKKDVKVKVITTNTQNEYLRSTLWILNQTKEEPNFEFKFITRLHAKIYIADDKYAIHGSPNLTDAGLKSNIEQFSIVKEKDEIEKLKNSFLDIWNKGNEKKIESIKIEKSEPKKEKSKAYSFDEIRKTYPRAYEKWTQSDYDFIKSYWKKEPKDRQEKIKVLMEKFGRNSGSITSLLRKLGLS